MSGKLYPVIGMRKMGEHIKVNFGQEEFVFDIDDHMKVCCHVRATTGIVLTWSITRMRRCEHMPR